LEAKHGGLKPELLLSNQKEIELYTSTRFVFKKAVPSRGTNPYRLKMNLDPGNQRHWEELSVTHNCNSEELIVPETQPESS
jgi:hypothetical protein